MTVELGLDKVARPGEVVWLRERSDGEGRRSLVELSAGAQEHGVRAWVLDLAFQRGGPWGGVRDFLGDLVSRLPEDLAKRHARELALVLPELRRSLDPAVLTLMERAPEKERVRGYPQDRAMRVVQGLVDLVGAWAEREQPPSWLLLCDRLDEAGSMTRTFLAELVRRKGRETGLTLIFTTAANVDEDPSLLFPAAPVHTIALEQRGGTPLQTAEPSDAEARAKELEAQIGDDPLVREARLPELIEAWNEADPERALQYQVEAFSLYTKHGFYRDALRYGEAVHPHIERFCGTDESLRMKLVNKFFGCLAVFGEPERALEIIETEGFRKIAEPGKRSALHYLAAMIYARYLPEKDLDRAVDHLEQGLGAINRAEMDDADRHFQTAFNRNGLALIRHFQKRSEEAIALCEESLERLRSHLDEEEHALHKSVLVYNIAQVYRSLGRDDEALEHYSRVIELDPGYSEYYNERGGIYLKQGRLAEAEQDFLRAIELSPPYPEVWTNLGQCYRRWGRTRDAVAAYSRALDLDPTQRLALMGRADARQSAGDQAEALADYSRFLEAYPDDWQALGNRAILLFEQGDGESALADLDRAVMAAPDQPELRSNRAVALSHLGRQDDAIADLQTCLSLLPGGAERSEVEKRLQALGVPPLSSTPQQAAPEIS